MKMTNGKFCLLFKLMNRTQTNTITTLAQTVNYCDPHELRELMNDEFVAVKFVMNIPTVFITAKGRSLVEGIHNHIEDLE